ncbi:MAG: branched-chain amino acid ABC transporter permease [Rhodospirillaceae bacterium]|nr:MAG: branched-chain amino acid ABC transporter permease [Rhodospirillaceae bacterium]
MKKSTYISLFVLTGVLIALGLIVPYWLSFLITVALSKGLVVLGLMLLMRAGMVSFGQGLYYCAGAYSVGAFSQYFKIDDILVLLLVAISVGGTVSAIVGLLLARYREIFFAMFSMAFSMILYGILVKSTSFGSSDGFNVISPTLFGWAPQLEGGPILPFITISLIVMIVSIMMYHYFNSPMGMAGEAIRENEIRVEYLGISVHRVIYYKYIMAAVLASIGGAMTAMTVGHIDPEMAYWTTSGEFVFITLMGGTAHVAAPFLGAVVFELMRSFAFQYSPYTWQMVLGIALLAIIIFLPKGLWSLKSKIIKGDQV